MKILLLTPPLTQLNTPYPATPYLTGFLRERGYQVIQSDPAIDLVLKLFSKQGLKDIYAAITANLGQETNSDSKKIKTSASVGYFIENFERYMATIETVIGFLQRRDTTVAMRLARGDMLPQGPRFNVLDELDQFEGLTWAFGAMGIHDRAKYFASLYLDDLADVIRDGVDQRFSLSRYGEKLAASQGSFDPLHKALQQPPTLVDQYIEDLTQQLWEREKPDVVGFTVPFPGNVYAAFRMAKCFKVLQPNIKTVLGGGYVNTELRKLSEPRVFDYFNYITLDDGERPLLTLLDHLKGKRSEQELHRTYCRVNNIVVRRDNPDLHDIPQRDIGCPTYDGLDLSSYLSICEMLNPMHRLWSDGRWNKLTLAHGCYWKSCNFCDISLDYIGRYEENPVDRIIDRIEQLISETGERGFHFVDEAAPPKVLFALSRRLLERKVQVSWWGNVRFEKSFTPAMAELMAEAGCIAISGGLEVASDRLLQMMKKGVTVSQVARVTHAFASAGILVHAYLMYGFPTQTIQETVDALERVRQLFTHGCIQSGFWHRFSATVHSPIGQNPEAFGIKLQSTEPGNFAENDLPFIDPSGVDHDFLGRGLNRALYNYMHGLELERSVKTWFDKRVPHPKVSPHLIEQALGSLTHS